MESSTGARGSVETPQAQAGHRGLRRGIGGSGGAPLAQWGLASGLYEWRDGGAAYEHRHTYTGLFIVVYDTIDHQ